MITALKIMGMGMLGIFTAMILIMLVTAILKKIDNTASKK